MTLKEEVKEIWKILKVVAGNIEIVSDKLNEATDRIDKYKWLKETKSEIAHTVYLMIRHQIEESAVQGYNDFLETKEGKERIMKIIKEAQNSSKSSNSNTPIV